MIFMSRSRFLPINTKQPTTNSICSLYLYQVIVISIIWNTHISYKYIPILPMECAMYVILLCLIPGSWYQNWNCNICCSYSRSKYYYCFYIWMETCFSIACCCTYTFDYGCFANESLERPSKKRCWTYEWCWECK